MNNFFVTIINGIKSKTVITGLLLLIVGGIGKDVYNNFSLPSEQKTTELIVSHIVACEKRNFVDSVMKLQTDANIIALKKAFDERNEKQDIKDANQALSQVRFYQEMIQAITGHKTYAIK